jgi:hypothetical protein
MSVGPMSNLPKPVEILYRGSSVRTWEEASLSLSPMPDTWFVRAYMGRGLAD